MGEWCLLLDAVIVDASGFAREHLLEHSSTVYPSTLVFVN